MRQSAQRDESIAYHAARILLLVSICGKPQRSIRNLPAIQGRTLLAKLDFFLRYPAYLRRAADILKRTFSQQEFGLATTPEPMSVESRMVRYLYGPWDHIYYPALAYLIGKELITIETKAGTDIFRLSPRGQAVASQLTESPEYEDLVQRARMAYKLFNQYTGNRLKQFIYLHFPEVVGRKIGAAI